jgi:polyferredoxin
MSVLQELKQLDKSPKALRKFGLTMGIFFLILSGFFYWREHVSYVPWTLGLSIFFLVPAVVWPKFLAPVQYLWMGFAFCLGFVMTRVLLGILFYGVVTPIGFILRLRGKDLMERKLDRGAPSYWKKRAPVKHDDYTRQF